MNKIRAVFFDIDGTLVGFNHKVITDETLAALQELRNQGILLIISSGRPYNLIHNLKDFRFDGYITMNGSYATYGEEVLLDCPIDRQEAVKVAEICDASHLPVVAFSSHASGINFENEVTARCNALLNIGGFPHVSMTDFAREYPVYQYTVYATPEDKERFFKKKNHKADWHRWHPEMADIIPSNTSKGLAVGKFIDYLGIDRSETISFGDGGNDIPMLQTTGLGIAMGNATEDVKAVADYVAGDADEEGIVTALKDFGLII